MQVVGDCLNRCWPSTSLGRSLSSDCLLPLLRQNPRGGKSSETELDFLPFSSSSCMNCTNCFQGQKHPGCMYPSNWLRKNTPTNQQDSTGTTQNSMLIIFSADHCEIQGCRFRNILEIYQQIYGGKDEPLWVTQTSSHQTKALQAFNLQQLSTTGIARKDTNMNKTIDTIPRKEVG